MILISYISASTCTFHLCCIYHTGAAATSFASFGQGVGPIHLDNVQCTGNEDTLWNCTAIVSNHNCAHFEDAGVTCGMLSSHEFGRNSELLI